MKDKKKIQLLDEIMISIGYTYLLYEWNEKDRLKIENAS